MWQLPKLPLCSYSCSLQSTSYMAAGVIFYINSYSSLAKTITLLKTLHQGPFNGPKTLHYLPSQYSVSQLSAEQNEKTAFPQMPAGPSPALGPYSSTIFSVKFIPHYPSQIGKPALPTPSSASFFSMKLTPYLQSIFLVDHLSPPTRMWTLWGLGFQLAPGTQQVLNKYLNRRMEVIWTQLADMDPWVLLMSSSEQKWFCSPVHGL